MGKVVRLPDNIYREIVIIQQKYKISWGAATQIWYSKIKNPINWK